MKTVLRTLIEMAKQELKTDLSNIENWKMKNCYDESKELCQECCSGGGLYGAMCTMMMEIEFEKGAQK